MVPAECEVEAPALLRLQRHAPAIAREAWRFLLALVYPQFCKVCDERLFDLQNHFYCPNCWEQPERILPPFCTGCGKPHTHMVGFVINDNFPCADCREKPNPHLTEIRAGAVYEGAVEEAVKLLKFHGRTRVARPLAALMVDFAAAYMQPESYTRIVPVPLHKVRQRERGFNQSELIALELLSAFPNATLDTQLKRIRPTLTQSRLRGDVRHKNVRGAFAYLGEDLKGARILLIDDVVTTAGTVTECARILKLAGAARVDVLAAAMAVPRQELV